MLTLRSRFGSSLVLMLAGMMLALLLAATGAARAASEPNAAQGLDAPFSVSSKSGVHLIPKGSTVIHLDNGQTVVNGPNGNTILRVADSLSALVPTPGGLVRATHVFSLPQGADVRRQGNAIEVYHGGELLLRVVEQSNNSSDTPPSSKCQPLFCGWIEYADATIPSVDTFQADWTVPTYPSNPGSAFGYLFNGLQQGTSGIVQPVLEWNYSNSQYNFSGRWAGAAWAVVNDQDYMYGPMFGVSAGDSITGELNWEANLSEWGIVFEDTTTLQSSSLNSSIVNTTSNLWAVTTMEGYNIDGNEDVPGNTEFDNMHMNYNGNDVEPNCNNTGTWCTYVDPDATKDGLTGLGVNVLSNSNLYLLTSG